MFNLSELFATFRKGSARRSSLRSLRSLSAAQLCDIGIGADQIGDVVDAMIDSGWERPAKSHSGSTRAGLSPRTQAAAAGCG